MEYLNNFHKYAYYYHEFGFNVSCLSYIKTKFNELNIEKSPYHSWYELQIREQKKKEIEILEWELATGIGAIMGNNIRCIDIDDCNDFEIVKKILLLLHLPYNYEWVAKTPNGYHIYLKSGELNLSYEVLRYGILLLTPNEEHSEKFSRLEFRWAGNCVLPPTKIKGREYKFVADKPQTEPSWTSIACVFNVIKRLCGTNVIDSLGNGKTNIQNYQIEVSAGGEGYGEPDTLNMWYKGEKVFTLPEGGNPYSNYLFLDLETTGLISNEFDLLSYPRIIQIAYSRYDNTSEYAGQEFIIEASHYVKASIPITQEITALTGLSNDFLERNGVVVAEALNALVETCFAKKILYETDYYNENRLRIICHNTDFDLAILDAEFYRNPNRISTSTKRNPLRDFNSLCTMKRFCEVHQGKYLKLSELYSYFFKEECKDKLHDAQNDLIVLKKCFKIMGLYGYFENYSSFPI